jgi:hypothetical protein
MADKNSSEGLGCLILAGILGAIVYGGYSGIDSAGWIPHREDSTITAQANWFVGESKECYSYPLDVQEAKAMNRSVGDAIYKINCDGGPEHKVTITFYGKIEQPKNAWASWNCARREDSFVCKQIGAEAVQKTQQQGGSNAGDYPRADDWRDLCNNSSHVMTLSEVREYAKKKGISPNDAGTAVGQAGCGIVADR